MIVSKYKQKVLKRKRSQLLPGGVKQMDQHVFIYIMLSRNNIHLTVTNSAGGVLFWTTSGKEKFKSRQKITSLAVKMMSEQLKVFIQEHNIQTVSLNFNGFNRLSEEMALSIDKFVRVDSLTEVSPVVFNGVRPCKRRRV